MGPKDSSVYTILLSEHGNTPQVLEWGVEKMVKNANYAVTDRDESRDVINLAHCIKNSSNNSFHLGLANWYMGNRHEAEYFFREDRDKKTTDSFSYILLDGVVAYCQKEPEKASASFKKVSKEMGSLVEIIMSTEDSLVMKKMENRLFLLLFDKVKQKPVASTKKIRRIGRLEISFQLFLSIIWAQIIAIPMVIFRK